MRERLDKERQDKKEFKDMLVEIKNDFKIAIKDKKRWITCFVELSIVAVLIVIDLLTKEYIYGYCYDNNTRIDIIKKVICFTWVNNTGASFGIFANKTEALTTVSIICATFLLIFMFYTYKRRNLWLRSALILILAGAIGNIVDRLTLGYVRDFIYFELTDFAVFNFADSCLTVGTIVLIIYIVFFYSKEEKDLEDKRKAERWASQLKNNVKIPKNSENIAGINDIETVDVSEKDNIGE